MWVQIYEAEGQQQQSTIKSLTKQQALEFIQLFGDPLRPEISRDEDCPKCKSSRKIDISHVGDTNRRFMCATCGHEWVSDVFLAHSK